ncbi:MAG: antitoxin [Candidatus Aminicenantes bacterium]|nr:antitoxin [Candidatus Aminicenantes bacterium]NIM81100.1 antitoxin [Candidatus Aminicenantes bacterium]NIN20474.1 antitoxin [Candidatus Aminicenantes bacterium]NIN44247.1 antitoxin [Candidatus Aminicenantes bacterium]NIN87066.1 antitoxin [Candidatus Aminicenantes bacterium]
MSSKKKYEDKKELLDALRNGETGLIDDPEEEREILEAYEKGELIPVENHEEKKKELIEAARNTPIKTKRITIRLSEQDLERLKVKAAETGIPYQTLIGSLVHQYASGRLIVQI